MGKYKLARFADNKRFNNVFEPDYTTISSDTFVQKGKWNLYFKNNNPIVLELACGKGEYTIGLAELYPNKNFIGIDLKGARLWVGAKYAKQNNLNNVAFIRTRVEFIASLFAENEISEIWITFPDPQNKKRKKRLTYPRFLALYKAILQEKGIVHLKTDAYKLHLYTLSLIKRNKLTLIRETSDLYHSDILNEELQINTFYESLFLEKDQSINYLQFLLNADTFEDSDFDEDAVADSFAKIPHDRKVRPSKLTQ